MKYLPFLIVVLILALGGLIIMRQLRKPLETVSSQSLPMQEIKLTSSAFEHNQEIPEKYAAKNGEVSPPLSALGIPLGTQSLTLIMHDPDAPREGGWTHWLRFNISWNSKDGTWSIREGTEPQGTAGKGTGGNLTYHGPRPPSGTHRYIFTLYALDRKLLLEEGATKSEVEKFMEGHILGKGELTGLYSAR